MPYYSVTEALEGWFDRKLNKLPLERRRVAVHHIPSWSTMSKIERQQRAREIDKQTDLKLQIKKNRIDRIGPPQAGSAESKEYEQAFAESSELVDQRVSAPPSETPGKLHDTPAQPPCPPMPFDSASGMKAGDGPGWKLKPSARFPGYRRSLYNALKAAHAAGEPCPKARDVLDWLTEHPSPDVQVMPDGLKYNDAKGNSKEANLKAIQQAIKGLTE